MKTWRQWPDGCLHYQGYNTCTGAWDNKPDGTPDVHWPLLCPLALPRGRPCPEFRVHQLCPIDDEPFRGRGGMDLRSSTAPSRRGSRQVAGRDLKIWRDDRLARNEFFWETIEKRLGEGGVLVSILTPRYVQSAACKREVQGYSDLFKQKRGSLRVRDRSPIFKVVKTPCGPDNLPAERSEVLDYPSFQLKPNGVAHELPIDLSPGDRCRYFDRLYDLAHDIHEMMNLLDQGAETAPPAKGAVYLAETSYELAAQRDEVRRDLQQRGYEVLPARPVPWGTPEFRQEIRADSRALTLSVHCRCCPGSCRKARRSDVALQDGLAAEASAARHFPRLLGCPRGWKRSRAAAGLHRPV